VRAALDTNVLAYAEGLNGSAMRAATLDFVSRLPQEAVLLPVQTLAELFHLLVRKAGRSPTRARAAVFDWLDSFPVIETSAGVLLGAVDLSADHRFKIWDALILSAAAEAGCRLLISEDLQDGFTWHGVTVTNPFATRRHPLLEGLLNAAEGF